MKIVHGLLSNEKEKKNLEEFRYKIALKVTDYLAQYKVNKLRNRYGGS